MSDLGNEVTQYGFKWGNVTVERICSDQRMGRFLGVYTDKEYMEIRITPGGKIRIYSHEYAKGRDISHA